MAVSPAGELREFHEKPKQPVPIATDPSHAYVSMGNYLFDPRVLVELLEQANGHGDTDFGRDILPLLPHRRRTFAYDFASNTVPGIRPCEERGYWRDIGTANAYQAAQREILGPSPRFSLINAEWPARGNASRQPDPAITANVSWSARSPG